MKQLTLLLGGKERVFDFGHIWFLKFYGQATGENPLNQTSFLLMPEKQFDFAVNTLYAGLQTHYKVNKKPFDFTRDELEDWVGCESMEFISSFLTKFMELNAPKGDKEEEKKAEAPEIGA